MRHYIYTTQVTNIKSVIKGLEWKKTQLDYLNACISFQEQPGLGMGASYFTSRQLIVSHRFTV